MATINHKTYNEGTETFKDFSVYDGKDTLIFKVDGSSGNVGIGTSAPTQALHISGTDKNILVDAGYIQLSYGSANYYTRLSTEYNFPYVDTVLRSEAGASYEGRIAFRTNSGGGATSTRAEIDNSGYLRLFGGGIQFNGDTAAANALDDYEEGTFTPTVVGTSTAGTATYTEQVGRYTKIGRLVQFEIYLVYSAGTGTGDLRVSGLPFTIGGTSYPPITIGAFDNITMTADNIPMAWGFSGTTTVVIQQMPTGGGAQAGIAYDASGSMQLTGTYSV